MMALHASPPFTGPPAPESQALVPSSASTTASVGNGESGRSYIGSLRRPPPSATANLDREDIEELDALEIRIHSMAGHVDLSTERVPHSSFAESTPDTFKSTASQNLKRPRENLENLDGNNLHDMLNNRGAVAALMYHSRMADSGANDVWPDFRDSAKVPVQYLMLHKQSQTSPGPRPLPRPAKVAKTNPEKDMCTQVSDEAPSSAFAGRPEWKLPVELVELIASHLNRDDIKSMRLVNRELNHHVSQVIFKTVVVPFNTEIYGMLGNDPNPDTKGKKKAKAGALAFVWKNANGDNVYDGYGLDVFRGFGRHIIKFAMAFEVNEDALAKPPQKCLMEPHSTFWGSYDWPFEEYCRFVDVAGLETAADETPRMKIAFSELSRVKELGLSVDSGLGWLNGPDRSIRSSILQRPPDIFGTLEEFPDRRTQAQQELWDYIDACHKESDSNVRFAMLYRSGAVRPSELLEASMAAKDQPTLPFMDPHVLQQAVGYETGDMCMPTSFEDPDILERFASKPAACPSGILFTSATQPNDAAQLVSPIIPGTLTTSQKEWLLETEWAQRAFLSSYMLSIIDNPTTFEPIHTLNISRLSDRYIPALNRLDFWDALPNLSKLVLKAIPSWRSVYKNEAGVVETPKINPAGAIDSFYALLKRVISQRRNITHLAIGWATGGEHAEGVHARNKHILPAPLVGMESATTIDPEALRDCLLQFPFVEHLTLENCWMTPPALTEFVKLHDALRLKHMIFESVSLTALMRNFPNNHHQAAANIQLPIFPLNSLPNAQNVQAPNPAAQQAAHVQQHNALDPNQILHFHIQALRQHIHHLQNLPGATTMQPQIVALQAQLQNQMYLAQQHSMPGQPQQTHPQQAQVTHLAQLALQVQNVQQQQAALPPTAPALPTQNSEAPRAPLKIMPRPGSWFNLVDMLTPGPNLADFDSEHSQADPERRTALQSMRFNSCGYVRLLWAGFEQPGIDPPVQNARDPFFTKRTATLAPAMLGAKWPLLGDIVQGINALEMAALSAGWHMQQGWEDKEAAQAPTFDGYAPGGTGRFSGIVRVEDRVAEEHA
jgi:hypothetical protein